MSMRVTAYLSPIEGVEDQRPTLREIRAAGTYSLLAHMDDVGNIYLFDRKSRFHYRLSLADIARLCTVPQIPAVATCATDAL